MIFLVVCVSAIPAETDIEGVWLTANGRGLIDIQLVDGFPVGSIVDPPADSDPSLPPDLDENNPDPSLRNRPLHGLPILRASSSSGASKWMCTIYNPDNGKVYQCVLTLVDANTVNLRGYLGISLFVRTQTWTRNL